MCTWHFNYNMHVLSFRVLLYTDASVVHGFVVGIIENDDIQHVTAEIDKALNFSRKVQMLVDSVKQKYRDRYVST